MEEENFSLSADFVFFIFAFLEFVDLYGLTIILLLWPLVLVLLSVVSFGLPDTVDADDSP